MSLGAVIGRRLLGIACGLVVGNGGALAETWQVTYQADGRSLTTAAESLREFADGSLLLLASDGRLLTLDPAEVTSRSLIEGPLASDSSADIVESLKEELGASFRFNVTRHYVIAYNTSQAYAQWVGQLFERLNRGFYNYFGTRRVQLHKSRFPLVAVVFADRASYLAHAQRDIGRSAESMIGYYNMNTNRIFMYDLTGVDGMVPPGQPVSSQAVVNQILSQPQAERTVATIVHEAVHQLSFNSGLQTRLADNPVWLSEGLAMFFESPDLQSPQGWKMGNINYHNYRLLSGYLSRRPEDSLRRLIQDDQRFHDAETIADAYPESWALTYYLLKAKGQQFAAYVRELSQLEPLGESTAEERVAMFVRHFGDLQRLDQDFVAFIRTLR